MYFRTQRMSARILYGINLRRDEIANAVNVSRAVVLPGILLSDAISSILIANPFRVFVGDFAAANVSRVTLILWRTGVVGGVFFRASSADMSSSTTLSNPKHRNSRPFFRASTSLNSAQRRRALTS